MYTGSALSNEVVQQIPPKLLMSMPPGRDRVRKHREGLNSVTFKDQEADDEGGAMKVQVCSMGPRS